MENRFWRFCSWLLHPLWLTFVGTFLIFQYHTVLHSKLMQANMTGLYAIIALSTILLPVVSALLFKVNNSAMQLEKADKQQRTILIISVLVYQLLLIYMMKKAGLTLFVESWMYGVAANLLAALLINRSLPISLHAMGWGGLTAMLCYLVPQSDGRVIWLAAAAFVLSGVVIAARLALNAHTVKEVSIGYILSFLLMLIVFTLHQYGI